MTANLLETCMKELRLRGFRLTPQRMVVLRVLHEAHGHLTPIEICERAQEMLPGLTEPTVYRTLNFLHEQRLALAAHVGSGQLVYETGERDHHHLVCRKCGATHEIPHDLLEALFSQFQHKTGYQIDGMHVTFFGLCPGCQDHQ